MSLPLLVELTNCLNSYSDTFERILESIGNSCDQETPIFLQTQDLLAIDAELKRNLKKMESWQVRQDEITALESELNGLTDRANNFAKALCSAQAEIQGCLYAAEKLQNTVYTSYTPTADELIQTGQHISKHTSGAPGLAGFGYGPYEPDTNVMMSGHLGEDSMLIQKPLVISKSISMEPLQTRRPITQDDESSDMYDDMSD